MSRKARIIGMVLFMVLLTACSSDEPNTEKTDSAEKPTEAREWVVKWNGEPEAAFLKTVEVLRENEEDHTMLVKVNPDVDQEKWRAKWILNDNIEFIQPNFQYKLNNEHDEQLGEDSSSVEGEEPAHDYFLEQTRAREAWNVWEPSKQVTIAVIDTGVDLGNPLISPHIVRPTNIVYPGESAADITVKDVQKPEEQGKTNAEIEAMYEEKGVYNDYGDRLRAVGHGTGVVGVLLQMLGLIDGVEPVEPTETSAKIMPIKVMGFTDGEKEGGSDFDMSEAIRMAVNRGADIISLSLGDWAYSKNARDAVEYAEEAGVLVVAAAGNRQGGTNEPIFFPAAFPNVLAVGGITADGEYDVYSNHGSGLDLVAPAEHIWTTTNIDGEAFTKMDGNSFSTPQVTAVAAMVMQHNPLMSPAQVRNVLRQTADSIEGGWNEQTGYGRVNAFRALTELPRADIYEENDTQSTAARISIDDRAEAVLETPEDEDWFVLDVPNLGGALDYHVQVRLDLPRSLEKGVELRVKQPGKDGFASYPVQSSEQLLLTVAPGDVYVNVRFKDGEPSPYLSYQLETRVLMAPDLYEDNDHQWNAYDLDIKDETFIEGTFHTEGDQDWYRLRTPDAGNLSIEVWAFSPRIDPVLFVQQLGGSGVLVDEMGPTQGEQLQIRVEAGGIYYIRVSDININPSIGKYELRVNYEPIIYDTNEPNDRSDQATWISTTAAPVLAAIQSVVDYDWYRFRVPEETEVTVFVTEMGEAVEAEVSIYGENKQAVERLTIAPDETEMIWTETLSGGEYYVRVRRLSGEETTPYAIGYLMPEVGDTDWGIFTTEY